ncbi:hypothetical protein HHK36_017259 [Tetracentron sinense]|uniref:Uncharacterized protein n=1 Tax=Tetracentron sinense TaxID=13715 RepID=A0A834Z7T2_TETSI|nr:hypothetical protein HHK36_017259 [Tetracentron sinense]
MSFSSARKREEKRIEQPVVDFKGRCEGRKQVDKTDEWASELHTLQNQLKDKEARISELKSEMKSVKLRLEKMTQEVPREKMEDFTILSEKYKKLEDEYNALMAEKLKNPQK